MKKNQGIQLLYLSIFLLSVFFRLNLALVNREANDDHMTVINFMLLTNKLPKKDKCWECFQPKLFHYTVAGILAQNGLGSVTDNPNQYIVIAQLINFVAGVITLIVLWVFITQFQLQNDRLKFLTFALVALNPPWIGISAQATNDTFVILFSTLAIYFANRLLQRQRNLDLLLLVVFAGLAVSSKANGWVAVIAIFIALLIKTLKQADQRGKSLTFAITFLFGVIMLATLNPLTQYIYNFQKYDTPVLVNMDKRDLPPLFEKDAIPDGGILSIQDGFFTFHYISLLVHPQIDYGNWNFTPQRTSFWTQLYAKAYSIHFDNYPPSWSSSSNDVVAISRGILILALLPTMLLVAGFMIEMSNFLKELFRAKVAPNLQGKNFGLFLLVFTGYVAFLIFYAFVYRDFTTIKAIFIFPALLALVVLFLTAGQMLYSYFSSRSRWGILIFEAGISALLLLYISDLIILIAQLQQYLS